MRLHACSLLLLSLASAGCWGDDCEIGACGEPSGGSAGLAGGAGRVQGGAGSLGAAAQGGAGAGGAAGAQGAGAGGVGAAGAAGAGQGGAGQAGAGQAGAGQGGTTGEAGAGAGGGAGESGASGQAGAAPVCGDKVKNQDSEQCDGLDLAGETCQTVLKKNAEGALACKADCSWDTSGCTSCGDGQKNGSEPCEGEDLGGQSCASRRGPRYKGALACVECAFDETGCVLACGDGIKDEGEECDGADVAGLRCPDGITPVDCSPQCRVDTSKCPILPGCGDGVIDAAKGEQCEGADLGGKTCGDLVPGSHGPLKCNLNCTFDRSACDDTCILDESSFDDGCVLGLLAQGVRHKPRWRWCQCAVSVLRGRRVAPPGRDLGACRQDALVERPRRAGG